MRRNFGADWLSVGMVTVGWELIHRTFATMRHLYSAVGAHLVRQQRVALAFGAKTRRCDPLIVLEQTTEPLAATDFAKRESRCVGDLGFLRYRRPNEKIVFVPFMRPFRMISFEPSLNDTSETFDDEEYEMVQALATNRADETFDERLRVRRLRRAGNFRDVQALQGNVKRFIELLVAVTLDVANSQAIGTGLIH